MAEITLTEISQPLNRAGRLRVEATQRFCQLLEERSVVVAEGVGPLVLDVERPNDSSTDEDRSDRFRSGRPQGGQIARILGDIVREDEATRLDRSAGEPTVRWEPWMSWSCGSAPREIRNLVSLDPVDANPASPGAQPHQVSDPLRALLGRALSFGHHSHRVRQSEVDHGFRA
jgi:hypothetical protein